MDAEMGLSRNRIGLGMGRGGPRHSAVADPGIAVLASMDFYWEGHDLVDNASSNATWTDRNAASDATLVGVNVGAGILSAGGTSTVDMPAASIPALGTSDNFTIAIVATGKPTSGDYERLWSSRDGTGTSEPGLAILWRGNINNIQVRAGDDTNAANAQHGSSERPTAARNLVVARFAGGSTLSLSTFNATDGLETASVGISAFGDCTPATAHPILFAEGTGGSFKFTGVSEAVAQTAGLLTDQQIIDLGGTLL